MMRPPRNGVHLKTPWAAVRRFLNNTTAHGLPRIPNARNQGGKFFWIIVWLAFFTVFFVEALILVSKYYNRHPTTVMTQSTAAELEMMDVGDRFVVDRQQIITIKSLVSRLHRDLHA